MANPKPVLNLKAIGYVLLWQSYWLPVLLIVAHDQWLQVRQLQPPDHRQQQPALASPSPSPTPSQAKAQTPLASLLAGESQSVDALPVVVAPGRALAPGQAVSNRESGSQGGRSLVTAAQVTALPRGMGLLSSATLEATSQPLRGPALAGQRPAGPFLGAQHRAALRLASLAPMRQALLPRSQLAAARSRLPLVSGVDRSSPVLRQFTGSELLGGLLTLQQPNQEPMSPLARAEQARLADSGDPLAPVPARWREPMRRELRELGPARLSPARVVHVPSERISHTVVLPLAMQHDGSIDALVAKDPAVSDRELSDWASRQATPAQGQVQPVVLHLHPLPRTAVTAKAIQPGPAPSAAEAPLLKQSPGPVGAP